jgi:7-cyano-7-deazaguanine synthase in queuosine biosynthesis
VNSPAESLKGEVHTWSCYESGLAHCGSCGPCMMRKTAFAMNGAVDPVFAAA